MQTRFVRFFSGERVQTVFKLVYLWLVLLSFNSFFANTVVLSCCSYALALFGAPIVVARVIDFKAYKDMPLIGLMCLFLLSFIISAVGAAKYGIVQNVQGFAWMTFEFFILFAHSVRESAEHVYGELEKVAKSVCWYTLVCSCLGLTMGVAGYADSIVVSEGAVNYFGVYQERLWGVYSDPNIGGVLCVLSVLFAIWLRARGKICLVLLALSVVIQTGYIAMSGSRGSVLCAVVSVFVLFGLPCWERLRKRSSAARAIGSVALALAGCAAVVFSMLLLGVALQKGADYVRNSTGGVEPLVSLAELYHCLGSAGDGGADGIVRSEEGISGVTERVSGAASSQLAEDWGSSLDVGHRLSSYLGEDASGFSAGRLSIWRSSLEVFGSSPVFGVSHRNILRYAEDVLPETFVAQARYTTMHNVALDVLASQGAVGFVVLTVMFALWARKVSVFLRAGLAPGFQGAALVAIVLAICVAAMFYTEILYINSPASIVFWIVSGFVCHLVRNNDVRLEVLGPLVKE